MVNERSEIKIYSADYRYIVVGQETLRVDKPASVLVYFNARAHERNARTFRHGVNGFFIGNAGNEQFNVHPAPRRVFESLG